MSRPHLSLVIHGDTVRRTQPCPLHGCEVDETSGLTTCGHVACPACGVGPPFPVYLDDYVMAICDSCSARWRL